MNILDRIILKTISRLALKKGITFKAEKLYWRLFSIFILKAPDIYFRRSALSAKYLHLKIKILALLRMRLHIQAECKGCTIMSGHFAETAFYIEDFACSILMNKRTKELTVDITLNEDITLVLKCIKNADSQEFFIKIPDVSLNKYKQLFNGYFISEFMNSIHSDSAMTIMCYYKYDNITLYPRINAVFQYDSLDIEPTGCVLSKEYIIGKLRKNNHLSSHYLNYEAIPAKIRGAVICTEDPSFGLHKGISQIAIGLALRADLSQKKLSRGGSSISMQLIKNALLSQDRTLCRKIEEAILTLLMENYYKVSKRDILEMYLNMIEFAPNVYGIEDASFFYFGKSCTTLSITEIVTLTYVIPRPIFFYKALLQKTEQLSTNLYRHVTHYSKVLVDKGICTKEEASTDELEYISFSNRFGKLPVKKENKSISIINTLHPAIREEVKRLFYEVNSRLTTSQMVIIAGLRTFEEQKVLYEKVPKVTNAKPGQSFHNYGLAFDFCLSVDNEYVWDKQADFDQNGTPDWSVIVEIFKKVGYTWGGDFKEINDTSHFEKTFGYSWEELYRKYSKKRKSDNYIVL